MKFALQIIIVLVIALKILILTSGINSHAPTRLAEEAKNFEMEAVVADYSDLVFEFDGDMSIKAYDRFNVDDFDFCILRGVGARRSEFMGQRGLVASYLLAKKARVLNGLYYQNYSGGLDKLRQHYHFVSSGIRVVKTKVFGRRAQILEQEWEYPVILKAVNSSKGRSIYKTNSREEMKKAFRGQKARNLLVQEFVPGGEDYRVIVLGGICVGAIKRVADEGEFLTNVSQGGKPEVAEVDNEMKYLSEKVCHQLDLEFAGVDLVRSSSGEWLVYEVNDAPQFGGFESATDINLGKKVLNYMCDKGI